MCIMNPISTLKITTYSNLRLSTNRKHYRTFETVRVFAISNGAFGVGNVSDMKCRRGYYSGRNCMAFFDIGNYML